MNGVDVSFFCLITKHLVKKHGDRLCTQDWYNQAIAALGDLERSYLEMELRVKRDEKPKGGA